MVKNGHGIFSEFPHGSLYLKGRDVCILVGFARRSNPSPALKKYCELLAANGFVVFVGLNVIDPDPDLARKELPDAAFVFLQYNAGFDFGLWSEVLKANADLFQANSITLLNDSTIPLSPVKLTKTMDAVKAATADVVALTDNYRPLHHFQSYFFTFKSTALRHKNVQRFWRNLEICDTKEEVIEKYECKLLENLNAWGLTTEILFSHKVLFPEISNERFKELKKMMGSPLLLMGDKLIATGLPMIKAALFFDARYDFSIYHLRFDSLNEHYDMATIKEHVAYLTQENTLGRTFNHKLRYRFMSMILGKKQVSRVFHKNHARLQARARKNLRQL